MRNNKRFKITDVQNSGFTGVKILVDTITGVNYLYYFVGQGGGITPLLDKNGSIIVTPIIDED